MSAEFGIGAGSDVSGNPSGGTGEASVTSGGTLISDANLGVGGAGVTGILNVSGGTVDANAQMVVGSGNTLYGAGWGTVNIGPGGTFNVGGSNITASGTAALQMAGYAGSTATVNVSGTGALLNVGMHYISVAVYGQGKLTVSQGGTVLSGLGFASSEAATIGSNAGADGVLTVTDAGSMFHATGQIDVGVTGDGSLIIQNGGSVISGGSTLNPQDGVVLGLISGGAGNLTVTGAGSELTNTGQFAVGGSSTTLAPGVDSGRP